MTTATAPRQICRQLKIRRADDFHLHLRDGEIMRAVLPASTESCARALIMPNLIPPITNLAAASAYRSQIVAAVPSGCDFTPLMTLYLTEDTHPRDIQDAVQSDIVQAVKLYPAGATTNSSSGVRDISAIRAVLDVMEATDMPLCVHGEAVGEQIDIFDREFVFIEKTLNVIRSTNPELRIVFEHITTEQAAEFVRANQPHVAATITVHHLVLNRSHLFAGGLRPHRYCLPVAKREIHRQALLQAAMGGETCFFLGTDSAPHTNRAKLSACGCAGIYSAPIALPCLAQLFEQHDSLDQLQGFTSEFGARFYNLPLNSGTQTLSKWDTPLSARKPLQIDHDQIEVFDPGFPLYWSID